MKHPHTSLNQGAVVRLSSSPDGTYQVVNIDEPSARCWVRSWPVGRHRAPTFVVALQQVSHI
ncbi:MAG: hypothetical protein R6W06_15440 [Prochlorococcaceae cyanobacterium]